MQRVAPPTSETLGKTGTLANERYERSEPTADSGKENLAGSQAQASEANRLAENEELVIPRAMRQHRYLSAQPRQQGLGLADDPAADMRVLFVIRSSVKPAAENPPAAVSQPNR